MTAESSGRQAERSPYNSVRSRAQNSRRYVLLHILLKEFARFVQCLFAPNIQP
jgi:hypothetical protein